MVVGCGSTALKGFSDLPWAPMDVGFDPGGPESSSQSTSGFFFHPHVTKKLVLK